MPGNMDTAFNNIKKESHKKSSSPNGQDINRGGGLKPLRIEIFFIEDWKKTKAIVLEGGGARPSLPGH